MEIKDSFREMQKIVDNFILKHGGYWAPLSMVSAVIEELGEVAREINSIEGYKPKKPIRKNSNLGEELADLLFSIICIANYYKIDLGENFDYIIEKYSKRDSTRFLPSD
ncbi:MAG: nucleotide pyrophosphohydrolase [Candidatus Hermodarchaeota archaeon]